MTAIASGSVPRYEELRLSSMFGPAVRDANTWKVFMGITEENQGTLCPARGLRQRSRR